jgi:hypothetical protein
MRHDRRWQSRLARACVAAAIAAAAATGMAANPAQAEPPDDGYLFTRLNDFAIGGVGSPGKAVPLWVDTARAVNPKITIDVSDLAGIATLTTGDECEVSGTTAVCELPDLAPFTDAIPLFFQPADGVSDGAEGTIVYTSSAGNFPSEEQTATLTVRNGFDLVALPNEPLAAKPGDEVTTDVKFANLGNQAATSLILTLSFSPGVVPDAYENCVYTPVEELPATWAQCLVESDEPIAPDPEVVYGLNGGFGVTIGPEAIGNELADYFLFGLDDAPELPDTVKLSTRGGGKKLTLTSTKASTKRLAAATEVDEGDNYGATDIQVENGSDLAAVGAALTGAVGDTVKAKVGVKNLGPAALDQWGGDGTSVAEFTVAVPPGVEVVRGPEFCAALTVDENGVVMDAPGDAGGVYYRCFSDLAYLGVGDSALVELEFKIKSLDPAAGAVSLDDKFREPPAWDDDNNANNTAPITIAVTAEGGGGEDGGTGGTGGELPVTGVQVGAIAGGGLALLALGGALFLVSRRRPVTLVPDDDND